MGHDSGNTAEDGNSQEAIPLLPIRGKDKQKKKKAFLMIKTPHVEI